MTDAPLIFSERPRPGCETKQLTIGFVIFPRMDQIDFTGPFEVLSRIPEAIVHIFGKKAEPIRDMMGLILTPEIAMADVPPLDVLVVPGGYGSHELMQDEETLSLIRNQMERGGIVYSVCTGALLCGAAGILQGRLATTHWAAWDLLPFYGATATRARVVVDGNLVSAAGVTAGIDGALVLASLLRGDAVAEEIQLGIEYAPNPVFHAGSPEAAPSGVLQSFQGRYAVMKELREAEARRVAAELRIMI